ncbi:MULTISPECIES: ATP-binding protein [unclassified Sphingopyxis]|jgi:two-component system, NtrC family, C4-dicarboxylate transport sensor histidine kinase DctB|uniref:sensor histidine kinase n=1 Tax=unclassified Sphingopyxis TaxID=2614943 RepID=UPI00285430BE|nr:MULTISPECIES: ATP-binding protein [unclassified Sphingopyxis]MDR6832974.1 two-component system C4-dicarboxylate transport sensor histidine kinase DctB [Sphingopyxis sp. BE122]MDR7228717.1 two-component system C4-dicarboxylate transport sensor histidine kinase DctB [Sphingopyxis sp. BE259]
MAGWADIMVRDRRRLIVPAVVAILLLAGLILSVDRVMYARALIQEKEVARDDAAILADGLRSELDKVSLLPITLAGDLQVRQLLEGDASQTGQLDIRLENLARQSGAAAIYVMDKDGLTLAASNWRQPATFVGSNYAFRRYFRQALNAGTSTEFALGTVSRRPGLYIAHRAGSAASPQGVVAVKIEFDALEASWRKTTDGVYVTDATGVVLLATDAAWRFRLTGEGVARARDAVQDEQRFGLARLEPLAIMRARGGGEPAIVEAPLFDTSQPISPDGWMLYLLVDPGPRAAAAIASGRLAVALALASTIAIAFALFFVRRRRQALQEEMVAQRTRTLRDQLSQANRLATLGQISAGVGHEIGQPVAAMRVFAENGEKLIARGRAQDASANFREIVGLADRLGLITGELRRFSRRQPGPRRLVRIGEIVDGASLLLRDRIVSMGVALQMPSADDLDIAVAAEHVRLEQVLVNLLQNALDAVGEAGAVAIEVVRNENDIRVRVCDSGPGIGADVVAQLFQPFATTKPDGLGLGLVISRDIMRDLGGDLVFEPDDRRTRFTMIIPRTK